MSFRWLLMPLAIVSVACSIKENRDSCPCFLTLDFRSVRSGVLSWYVCEPSAETVAGTFEEESSPREVCLPVERGKCMVVVAIGEGFEADEGLVVAPGDDCPELWMSRDTVDTRRDEARCQVILHKEYAVATVRLMGEPASGVDYVISGGSCGYYPDGTLRHGEFSVRFPSGSAIGELVARIPRQDDNSLRLNVYESSVLVRSFPIGEMLLASGYNWHSEDLEDFVIALDYSSSRISLSSDLWMETFSYDVRL